ncbi:MAG: sodium:proton antiporter [Rhizomicrobium sp.]|jgi:CPA1 family monovalent cation:H+ antiporter
MTPFQLAAALLTLVALVGWGNVKTLRLPNGVAMMIAGLLGALILFAMQRLNLGAHIVAQIGDTVRHIDFAQTVVGYMLAFLLFAGAMQVDLTAMRNNWMSVAALATLGVAGSIVIVGFGAYYIARALGVALPLPWALVFGALISPTDPVAVLATVKHVKLSKKLQVILEGEALFNDGVGIVCFLALLALATGTGSVAPLAVIGKVAIQALGGLGLGAVAGWCVIRAMNTMDEFAIETTMTIALTMVVYAGAQSLGLSGAIAVVGAGMLFGGQRAKKAMEGETEPYLRGFWTLVDEILNALLFLLLGVEMLAVPFHLNQAGLLIAVVPLVLLSRFVIVAPWGAWYSIRNAEKGAIPILGWGGLHGALSLALALSLPPGGPRNLILSVTYAVVAFSITVQGLTFLPLTRWLQRQA